MRRRRGFTVIEVIVIVVVLGILAGLVTVGFGSWRQTLAKQEIQSDLNSLAAAMGSALNFSNGYPQYIPSTVSMSDNVTLTYVKGDAQGYCVEARSSEAPSLIYYLSSNEKQPMVGTCATVVLNEGSGGVPAIAYSDNFVGTGTLGSMSTGSPSVPWQFLNSTSSTWTRNSSGYASTTTAASSNPIAFVDTRVADVSITAQPRSMGSAVYFRVTDSGNWLRLRVNQTSSTSTSTSYTSYYEYQVRNEPTWYSNGGPISSTSSGAITNCQNWANQMMASGSYTAWRGCSTAVQNTSTTTSYYYYLILDKSVGGAVTQLASTYVGSTMPAYVKVVAKGNSLQTSYGSNSSTTSTGSTVSDGTNASSTKHGIGYAQSSSGTPTGVTSVSIVNAP
jgi:Tfp pilus assembly protein PilE